MKEILHPNEVILTFETQNEFQKEANSLGKAHQGALKEQLERQQRIRNATSG